MTQTIARSAALGPAYTGQAIGYRVLNLDRTVYSAFTTAGVAEAAVPGTYSVSGGIVAPDAGGYVVWGTATTDVIWGTIEPAAAVTVWAASTRTLTSFGSLVADVAAAAAAAVWAYTGAEPSSVPSANTTMLAKLGWLFALARNKIIQTSTSQILYNDTDTNTIGTSAQSADNTSFYRDKWQ